MKTSAMKMAKPALAAAIATVIYAQGATAADPNIDQRLESVEQRLEYTEQRLKHQDDTILEVQDSNGIVIGGLVEVDATSSEGDQDINITTVELAIGAGISDGVFAEIVLLYEGEGTDLEVDTAAITIAPEGSSASFIAGKYVVPFGVYETNLLSDPIALDLAETSDAGIIQVDYETGPVGISVYAFNGEGNDEALDSYGMNLGLGLEDAGLNFNLGFINDVSQSGLLIDSGFGGEEVAGTAFSAVYEISSFTFIGERIIVNDALSDGTEPTATNLEAAMGTMLGSKASTIAIAYQSTDDAQNLDLPEKRIAAALSIGIMKNTGLGFEYKKDTSYADETTNTFTARLSVEF